MVSTVTVSDVTACQGRGSGLLTGDSGDSGDRGAQLQGVAAHGKLGPVRAAGCGLNTT